MKSLMSVRQRWRDALMRPDDSVDVSAGWRISAFFITKTGGPTVRRVFKSGFSRAVEHFFSA